MAYQLEYSFDDEPVSKFNYDLASRKIEAYFNGYFDLQKNEYIDLPCKFIIENWEYARSLVGDEQKQYDIGEQIGFFTLILYMKYNDDNELELLVNTVDNRYLTIHFKSPKLSLTLCPVS